MSMIKKLRTRISSAHIIAMIALFVALSGTSYAAATIRASQIRNNVATDGEVSSRSIWATNPLVTPAASATCRAVRPRSRRAARSRLPNRGAGRGGEIIGRAIR